MRHKIIPVFIPHASCPNKCIFCNQNEITQVDGYDIGSVKAHIEGSLAAMKDNGTTKEIAFYGGSFTAIGEEEQKALLEVAHKYIVQKRVDSLRVSTRPDYIDEEILSRLKSHGAKTVELGIQSMCDDVLEANLRGHSMEDSVNASKMIKDAGFKLGHQIMPGLYKDTPETMLRTIEESVRLKPDFLRVYPCLVVRGTKLCELYESGDYKPLPLDDAVKICGDIYLKAKSAGIKVIRMGIHPERDFVDGGFVAGPFHPAFKHLVISALFLKLSRSLIEKGASENKSVCDSVTFSVNNKDISNFVGINKNNIKLLKKIYSIGNLELMSNETQKEGSIYLSMNDRHYGAGILDMPYKPVNT